MVNYRNHAASPYAEFGNASAALDGMAPEAMAARPLQGLAETAMMHSDVPCLRDDKANPHVTWSRIMLHRSNAEHALWVVGLLGVTLREAVLCSFAKLSG